MRVSTAFWSIVLIGSTMSVAAGFVGGRSIGSAGALPVAGRRHADDGLPAPIKQTSLHRALAGAHSLDAAGAYDPYGDPDLAVTGSARKAGGFDAQNERAKIAVIVVDAGSAGGVDRFVRAPLPLALALSPGDDDAEGLLNAIEGAGKTALVDANGVTPDRVAALLHDGAQGVIASLDAGHAKALLHRIGATPLIVDAQLSEDDELATVARKMHRPIYTRDVIADARDEAAYVEFMLRDALALAQRTGSAIVAVHARTTTLNALVHFADRAQRDGADIVALSALEH